jgi:molecular chaperone GrpE
MTKKKHKNMNEKLEQETEEQTSNLTDNLADNTPNAQDDGIADELARTKDAYLRLMAEYDNYRKRTVKEKAELIKNGGEKMLGALLPVVDDFERAIQTVEKATDIEAIKEGLLLIFNKFQSYLGQNGAKKIETGEQAFDPDLHEAIAMVPAADESQKGKIIDTVQTGYMLNDKVLRHAKVVVAN